MSIALLWRARQALEQSLLQLSGDSDSIDLHLIGYDFEALNEAAVDAANKEALDHTVLGRGLKASGDERTLLILETISVSS